MAKIGWLLKTVTTFILVLNTILWATLGIILSFTPWSRWTSSFCSRSWTWLNLFLTGVKVVRTGFEKIDYKRNYMLMANHRSLTDIFAFIGYTGLSARPVIKKELMKIPLVGTAFRRGDCIVIDRADRVGAIEEMNRVGEKLRRLNLSVAIYPEGTRQTKLLMGPLKKGGFQLAISLGLPILPIVFWGADRLHLKGESIIRSGTIRMHACDVVETTGYTAEKVDELLEKVRAMMLAEIAKLQVEMGG